MHDFFLYIRLHEDVMRQKATKPKSVAIFPMRVPIP